MTLIVYKDGELAADNGCTRNDSREYFRKIRVLRKGNSTLTIGYSGNIDAVARHWNEVLKRVQNHKSLFEDYPTMNVAGIAVLAPDEPTYDDPIQTFYFNCFAHCTGGGAWVLEESKMVCEGADFAAASAIAINHVAPSLSAAQIVKAVSEVNSAADTRFGVSRVAVVNPDGREPSTCYME